MNPFYKSKLSLMIFFCLAIVFVGCASPKWMGYQRSEYSLFRVDGLMVSTSADFFSQEIQRSDVALELLANLVIQNIGDKDIQINLSAGSAKIRDLTFPLNCRSQKSLEPILNLSPGKKEQVICSLFLNLSQNPKADSWVHFDLPISKEKSIQVKKLLRMEDFE